MESEDPSIAPGFYDNVKENTIEGIGQLKSRWLDEDVKYKFLKYNDLLFNYEEDMKKATDAKNESEIRSLGPKIYNHCIKSINQLVAIENYELEGHLRLWKAYISCHRRVRNFINRMAFLSIAKFNNVAAYTSRLILAMDDSRFLSKKELDNHPLVTYHESMRKRASKAVKELIEILYVHC